MKILFIENRYTTRVFERVAAHLRGQGHGVAWLVQNHLFAPPGLPGVHCIPYPRVAHDQAPAVPAQFQHLAQIDRGVRYFGGSPNHYAHYARHIDRVINLEQPDVVFGESTQFHELITIAACRAHGIPFLHPAATRIPHGRISFLVGDTLDTCAGSGETLQRDLAEAIVQAVAERRYTAFTNATATGAEPSVWQRRQRVIGDKLTMVRAWLQGERFVTPSPWCKRALEQRRQEVLAQIDALTSASTLEHQRPARYVLYPMQMQPETNIDVWGAPYHDQVRIINEAAQSLAGTGCQLIVKLNPTAKYELLEPGLMQCLRQPGIVVAPRRMPMAPLFADATALLTVTGSVLYECIFSGKPVFVLGQHALSRLVGVTALASPAGLGQAVVAIAPNPDAKANGVAVVQEVVRSSYPGYWFDPLSMQQYDTARNWAQLGAAFDQLLQALPARAEPATGLAA